MHGLLIPAAVLAAALGLLLAYAIRVAVAGRVSSARLANERGTVLLGRFPIEAFHWVVRGLGRTLARLGVSPDAITILSLLISASSLPLIALSSFEWAGLMLVLGSSLDALDGAVARERGIASDAGEVLDAIVDRYADALPLAGLAVYYRDSVGALLVVMLVMVGGMMVSYVRAKAESFQLSLRGGLMRRPERLAYLCMALTLGPTLSRLFFPSSVRCPVILAVVALIGVISNWASVKLMLEARSQLRSRKPTEAS